MSVTVGLLEVVANEKLRPLLGQGERNINDGMLLAAEVGIVDMTGEVKEGIDGSGEAFKEVELETGNLKGMSVGDEVKTGVDGVLDEGFRGVEPETATLMAASQLFLLALKLDWILDVYKQKNKTSIQETGRLVLTNPGN